MKIGVVREIKAEEYGVVMTPSGVRGALETWNITLVHDDIDRLIDAFRSETL